MKANPLRHALKAMCVATLLLASRCQIMAQDGYKRPKPDDSTQASNLAMAVLTLAPPQPPSSPPSQSAVAATMQSATTNHTVTPNTFSQWLAADSDLNQSVTNVAANQVSPTRQGHDPAKFRVVLKLVKTLAASNPPLRLDALQTIYNNADQVSTIQQLNESEQLCSVIHAALVRNGQAPEYEFRHSAMYKRIQRRRIFLQNNPPQS